MLNRREILRGAVAAVATALLPLPALASVKRVVVVPAKPMPLVNFKKRHTHSVMQYLDCFLVDEPTQRELELCASIDVRICDTLARFGFGFDRTATHMLRAADSLSQDPPDGCGERHDWLAAKTTCGLMFRMDQDYWYMTHEITGEAVVRNHKFQFGPPDDADPVEKVTYGNAFERFGYSRIDGKRFYTNEDCIGDDKTLRDVDSLTLRGSSLLQQRGIDLNAICVWQKTAKPGDSLTLYDRQRIGWNIFYRNECNGIQRRLKEEWSFLTEQQ